MSYEFGNYEEVLFPFGGLNGDDFPPDDEYIDLFDDESAEGEDTEEE